MKVNGTRVEDLAGTGLFTRQRYVIPVGWTVLTNTLNGAGRGLAWAVRWSVRAWTVTVPAAVLLAVWGRFGRTQRRRTEDGPAAPRRRTGR